ncbi:AMP-dependent synthetase [Sphingobacterium mizutaii NBRC 14946 = DSM 11724]|uniref:Long-chain-fatty-acid--CoA ligase FadD15 n=2 Tax=Sphingobacterium mizutaii TaxID=1010 RepID=A0AAJ4X9L8_9SPHI|nr:long-chain fatty acid--CoA ligase [Sphingobacterium mizutaii]GEM68687.1 AMP-dependent synthetase [Sphingobacterium mizutaii NBRC 14946 = DSM 11724]SDK86438.1 long-chain acyl-CoA synthetase [Sphingobacterium mizutaii]SNV45743.1 Long-chain-fatty-acid--CoA ligase FadD15 [Sphingobacterium mizutaii]
MSNNKRLFDLISNYQKDFAKDIMVAGRSKDGWKTYSSNEFVEIVDYISKGLLAKGIQKGDRIALMSGNRPEWNFIDFACNQLGVATVPLYPTLSNQDLIYILNDAGAKLLFVSNEELAKKADLALKENNQELEVFTFDDIQDRKNYLEVLGLGKQNDQDLQPFRDAVQPDDLLTLIYTSGTTGKPKGVYLSHNNIISNVEACNHLVTDEYKKALSFLPLCHIFERMVVYLYLSKGVQIYYAENLDNIVVDINDVKPDLFTTVPRVLEKVYDKVVEKGKNLTGIKKSLFFWALNLGLRYQEPKKNSGFYNFQLGIARKLIFSKWKDALGGNIKLIISGGAALQERLARVFWAAGIKVLEGYGLTETSPVIAVNSWKEEDVKFGTVGRVLDNLDVKIAQDGEILVKGPSVTSGYYHNDEATKEAFTEDGYLHTGDIGELTPDGFLRITDRKKEMFKTAGGKYVAPQVLENKLMESTLIAQVMVIGENQRFPAALIVPAYEELEKYANHKGISYSSKEDLIKNSDILTKYEQIISQSMANFGHWEQVKKFKLLPKEWTIDAGELTPKLSLKRKVILQKNEEVIKSIYSEQG